MDYTVRINLGLAEKLANRDYRRKFFRLRTQDKIAEQIIAFRDMRDLTQRQLAERCGMKQPAISRIEQSDYNSWTLNTLLRVADALDVSISVVFEPAEDVVERLSGLDSEQTSTAHTDNLVGGASTLYRPLGIATSLAKSLPTFSSNYEIAGEING